MTEAAFTITTDMRECMLRIKLRGFWNAQTARAFMEAEQAAASSLPCARNEHLVLANLSEFNLQSQEVVGMLEAFIRGAGLKA